MRWLGCGAAIMMRVPSGSYGFFGYFFDVSNGLMVITTLEPLGCLAVKRLGRVVVVLA